MSSSTRNRTENMISGGEEGESGQGIFFAVKEDWSKGREPVMYHSTKKVYKKGGRLVIDPPDTLGYKEYVKRDKNDQGMRIARSYAEINCYVKMGIICKKNADAIMDLGMKYVEEDCPNSMKITLKNAIAIRDSLRTAATTGDKWSDYMDLNGLNLDVDAFNLDSEKKEEAKEN